MNRSSCEWYLAFILRAVGVTCLLAIVPLFMPREWIARTHELMGLGTFPEQPIAEYLARSASGLSAFYGGILVICSTDVTRYARMIAYQAIAILLLSSCGLVLGTSAGIPLFWVALDTVLCASYCLPSLWLLKQMQRENDAK